MALAIPSARPHRAAYEGVEAHLDQPAKYWEVRPQPATSYTSTYTRVWMRGTARMPSGRAFGLLSTYAPPG